MNLFNEILWWLGLFIAVAALILFYTTLTMGLYLYIEDKLKKYL